MHPAYSVIFFTTASGAGYGLLIWTCLYGMFDLLPEQSWFLFFTFGLAFALITLGLLSSTFHLGHPERAWRALSQWQSSWLSREGIAAILTYIPSGLIAIGWIFLDAGGNVWSTLALITILLAISTIYCTGMIYTSLRTVRQWNLISVPYIYIILGLATGAILIHFLMMSFEVRNEIITLITVSLLLLGLIAKNQYWHCIDHLKEEYTIGEATGLEKLGKVSALDPPHSQPNFVMREMGYKVARKHSNKLRFYTILSLFILPVILISITLIDIYSLNVTLSVLSVVSATIGVFLERWLFFAEAKHAVNLYYGEQLV